MPSVRISELSSSINVTADDTFPIVDSSVTKKATAAIVKDFVLGRSGSNNTIHISSSDALNVSAVNKINIFGTTNITGSLTVTQFITGSIQTASYAVTASHALNGLTISGSDTTGNTYNKLFTKLQFDDTTGLHVSESSVGTAFVSIASHFRDIVVSGSGMLRATGSDAVEIIASGGISVSVSNTDTNGNGYTKELRFNATALSQSLSSQITQLQQNSGGSSVSASWASSSISSSYATVAQTLLGTVESASYAVTASYVLNSPSAVAFPFTGSAVISGSQLITGSFKVLSDSVGDYYNILMESLEGAIQLSTTGSGATPNDIEFNSSQDLYNWVDRDIYNSAKGDIYILAGDNVDNPLASVYMNTNYLYLDAQSGAPQAGVSGMYMTFASGAIEVNEPGNHFVVAVPFINFRVGNSETQYNMDDSGSLQIPKRIQYRNGSGSIPATNIGSFVGSTIMSSSVVSASAINLPFYEASADTGTIRVTYHSRYDANNLTDVKSGEIIFTRTPGVTPNIMSQSLYSLIQGSNAVNITGELYSGSLGTESIRIRLLATNDSTVEMGVLTFSMVELSDVTTYSYPT